MSLVQLIDLPDLSDARGGASCIRIIEISSV